jgi:hypothetical protein
MPEPDVCTLPSFILTPKMLQLNFIGEMKFSFSRFRSMLSSINKKPLFLPNSRFQPDTFSPVFIRKLPLLSRERGGVRGNRNDKP